LAVDTIVICAGQVSNRDMLAELLETGIETHVIGGAKEAFELDAMRAGPVSPPDHSMFLQTFGLT
ncbi:MAG: hypothetical protein JSV48_01475, partial [Bradyrhizobium sp.]